MTHSISRYVSDEVLSRGIQIESAGKPTARARTSSATGLAQFVSATWLAVIHAHRPDLGKTRTRSQLLALRTDPSLSIELMARHWEDNGRAIGSFADGDLYLAHFAGVGAALRILRAEAGRAVSDVVSQRAIDANPSILRGKTCGQVRAWAARKMAGAGGHDWVARWYRAEVKRLPPSEVSRGEVGSSVTFQRGGQGAAIVAGLTLMVLCIAYLMTQ